MGETIVRYGLALQATYPPGWHLLEIDGRRCERPGRFGAQPMLFGGRAGAEAMAQDLAEWNGSLRVVEVTMTVSQASRTSPDTVPKAPNQPE